MGLGSTVDVFHDSIHDQRTAALAMEVRQNDDILNVKNKRSVANNPPAANALASALHAD